MGCLTMLVSKLVIAQVAPTPPAPSTVESEPPFSVVIERDDLAVSCPDLPWFTERIASHAGKAGHAGQFKATLTKRGEAWQARIQRWEQNSSSFEAPRVLEDRSPTCEPLAEAAALTIAILADDTAQRAEPPKPVEEPPKKLPPVTPPVTPKSDGKRGVKVWVGAGGGVAMHWIAPVAPVTRTLPVII